MRVGLLFAVLLVGVAASIYSRFAALLFYLWFAIFRPLEWVFWYDFSRLRPSLVIGGLLVIPCLLTGILPKLAHPLSVGCLLFLGTALIAHTNAIRPDLSWLWIDFFARLMLVSFLMIRLITTKRRFIAVLGVIALSIGYHSAKGGVAFLLVGGTRFAEGLGGAFTDNGHYALAIVMILPFVLACAQNVEWPWVRGVLLLVIPLSCLTVVGTFERSGFLALVTVVLAYSLLQPKRGRALVVAAVVALIAVAVIPVPKGYADRMRTIRTYEEVGDASALGRLHFWQVAWDMALDKPLGIGLRNYEPLYDSYDFSNGLYGRERAVHNSHLQILAENGFAGFGVWLFLLGYSYLLLIRVRRRSSRGSCPNGSNRFYLTTSNGLIASQTAFVVGGTFLSAAHNDLTWYSFGLVAALDLLQRAECPLEVPQLPGLETDRSVPPGRAVSEGLPVRAGA